MALTGVAPRPAHAKLCSGPMSSYFVRAALLGAALVSFLVAASACGQQATRKSKASPDSGDLFEDDQAYTDDDDQTPSTTIGVSNKDAGVITVPTRPSDGGHDGRAAEDDAGSLCAGDIQPGDLRVVEIMISSKSGQGDTGEWVEIQSARSCSLNVKGVTIASPRGTGSDTVTVQTDLIIPPYGTFIVADDADPTKNGGLPTPVIGWSTTDVLKNDGDSVEITVGASSIDKVTYPSLSTSPGTSLAFPADCAWSDRATWSKWSNSVSTFGAGALKGTPNHDNSDVTCY